MELNETWRLSVVFGCQLRRYAAGKVACGDLTLRGQLEATTYPAEDSHHGGYPHRVQSRANVGVTEKCISAVERIKGIRKLATCEIY